MPPVNVLVKPASSACNMDCRYCFYQDEADKRAHGFAGMMSLETAEALVSTAMEYAEGACSFLFQGGEPTLAGLDFYRSFLQLEKKYSKPGVAIQNSIQTNGYLIDDAWAAFLHDNRFLTGLSLDGPAQIHVSTEPTERAKAPLPHNAAARLLEKHGAPYNILSVVTGQTRARLKKLIGFSCGTAFDIYNLSPAWSRWARSVARRAIISPAMNMKHFCFASLISGWQI